MIIMVYSTLDDNYTEKTYNHKGEDYLAQMDTFTLHFIITRSKYRSSPPS